MTPRLFTAGWLVSAALLSSWAVSSASDQPRMVPVQAVTPDPEELPALSRQVDAEITRLASRTSYIVPTAANARDPFMFARRARRGASGVSRAAAVSELSSPASLSRADALLDVSNVPRQPTLSGVAEMTPGLFTAVISFGGELHFMRKGDVVAGRYRIDAIALDGVDIFDLVLGTISRLKLQA
jgi:hypothetical protein